MRHLSGLVAASVALMVTPGGGDWPAFGGDPGAGRFSPLTQITPENVASLEPAWTFDTGGSNLHATPLVIGNVMYVSAGSSIFALEPETSRQIWRYDADALMGRRGAAYWPGDATTGPRLFVGVGDGRMLALDARSGRPAEGFGKGGYIDLKSSVRGSADSRFLLTSPPAVYRDIVITGGSNAEGQPSAGLYGDIRGWDARTGALRWTFHTVPRAGEPGVETWEGDSWKDRSGTNAWSMMSVDAERGLVFVPTGSPTSDFYGGDRKGKNLYGNSVLALDAATGALTWYQQLVHHDIWDWDLPAAPTLIDVMRDGRSVPAVAVVTKMSTLFIFDRVTGAPLFGVEERPVPQSDVPGEATWPTQPFPVRPPPLARTVFDPEKDMYALTAAHAAFCRELWTANAMYTHGIFTPPRLEGTMVTFPSTLGGANWGGLSYDPQRRRLYVNVMNLGQVARMQRRVDAAPGEPEYTRTSPWRTTIGRFWDPKSRIPCSAPPFGELVAVDVDRAEVGWRVPLGFVEELRARGVPDTGTLSMGGALATATGVIFIGATIDRQFRAFHADTGRQLWEAPLEAAAHSSPMTFRGRDGRQYVAIAAGGGSYLASPPGTKIVAFALRQRASEDHPAVD